MKDYSVGTRWKSIAQGGEDASLMECRIDRFQLLRYGFMLLALWAISTSQVLAQSPESRSESQRIVQQIGLDQNLNAQVPLDLEFQDEHGNRVTLGKYFTDKPVILTLVYYRCPMLCTQVLNGLLESSQAVSLTMGQDYHIVSVSIDPRETPAMALAKKKRYAESYYRPGAESGWHFLTGKQQAIDRLAETVGYRYVYDPKSGQFAHASGIIILTPDGRISRYFYGIDYVPDDLKQSLIESSHKKISTPIDQFLLLCFHYDPATGTYGFAIAKAIRILGIITVVVLGLFLWSMFRQERKRSAVEIATIHTGNSVPVLASSQPGSE